MYTVLETADYKISIGESLVVDKKIRRVHILITKRGVII